VLVKLFGKLCLNRAEFASHRSTLCSILFPQLLPLFLVFFSFLLAGYTLLVSEFARERAVGNSDECPSRITDSLACEATM
jgi:hypothetical protein